MNWTKGDVTHGAALLVSVILWAFGAKMGVASDVISYAEGFAKFLMGSIFGVALARGQ